MALTQTGSLERALDTDSLTAAMTGIGMAFAAQQSVEADIEDTLLFASIEAMERDDLRVLSLLVNWFFVHSRGVDAERLPELVRSQQSVRVCALWSGLASAVATSDARFITLATLHHGPRIDLLRVGTDFQIEHRGEDPRFASGPLRVPANVLRERASDVLTPDQLAVRHSVYRSRRDRWTAP